MLCFYDFFLFFLHESIQYIYIYILVLSVFDTGLVVGGLHVQESHFGLRSV